MSHGRLNTQNKQHFGVTNILSVWLYHHIISSYSVIQPLTGQWTLLKIQYL